MEDPFRTSIAVIMPASFYGSDKMSHCTTMFIGQTNEVDFTKRQTERIVAQLTKMDMWWPGRIDTHASGFDMFGVDKDKPVALLNDERLLEQRWELERIMESYGMEWNSMFDYSPHITLPKDARVKSYPNNMRVCLRPPVLWWGDDRPNLNRSLQSPFVV